MIQRSNISPVRDGPEDVSVDGELSFDMLWTLVVSCQQWVSPHLFAMKTQQDAVAVIAEEEEVAEICGGDAGRCH